ncbi:NFATC2-interacting protein [Diretmus argenteus]
MSDSDSAPEVITLPPKRRRIIDPSAITSVPIYSNKVSRSKRVYSSFQMKPTPVALAENENAGDFSDAGLWSPPPTKEIIIHSLIDSEEEPEVAEKSEEPATRSGQRLGPPEEDDDGDVIIVTSSSGRQGPPQESPQAARVIPLKIRCRTDLHKIPVLSSAPLSTVVDQLAAKLKVPPFRILLLRKERELPTHLSADQLGLGIADIIDSVVITDKDKPEAEDDGVITVRLQGKDKGSTREYSLHREAPLGSILSQYLSSMGSARRKMHFRFDGSRITHSQTPSQLDMEDGDVIEAWT